QRHPLSLHDALPIWARDHPVPAAIRVAADFPHVAQELREIPEIVPEREDLVDRRGHEDRLADVDAAAAALAEQALRVDVRRRPRDRKSTRLNSSHAK